MSSLPNITAYIWTDDLGKQTVLGAAIDPLEVRGLGRISGTAQRSEYVPVSSLTELARAAKRYLDASIDVASLLPEQDTKWPDGYDFEYLEKAQSEDMESARALREMCEPLLAQTENTDG